METRGTRRPYLEEYFLSIGGVPGGQGEISGEGWKVVIGEENSCALGSIVLPSVKLSFYARRETLEKILGGFRLKFLTAGG